MRIPYKNNCIICVRMYAFISRKRKVHIRSLKNILNPYMCTSLKITIFLGNMFSKTFDVHHMINTWKTFMKIQMIPNKDIEGPQKYKK